MKSYRIGAKRYKIREVGGCLVVTLPDTEDFQNGDFVKFMGTENGIVIKKIEVKHGTDQPKP